MCCAFASLVLFGPRIVGLLWWLIQPLRWQSAFHTWPAWVWLWPILGLVFLPWTTLMYVLVAPTGQVDGWNWLWIILALVCDIVSYSGSAYGNRDRIPGYSSSSSS